MLKPSGGERVVAGVEHLRPPELPFPQGQEHVLPLPRGERLRL